MNRKYLLLGIAIIACISIAALIFTFKIPDEDRQYDLPKGTSPALLIPFTNASNLTGIGPSYPYHKGFDYFFVDDVEIVAPATGYIDNVTFFYNDVGHHWQTNVMIRLNEEWAFCISFESWATTIELGQIQETAIMVEFGEKVTAGQKIGTLLYHGESCHIDAGLLDNWQGTCVYPYLTPGAKTTLDALFAANTPSGTLPCNG